MADYIRRDIVLKIINTVNDTGGFAGYADYCVLFDEIDTMPAADVQPVKHWNKYPEIKPIYDGDYLCYHKGFCNVYEYFREQWYSESGEVIKQIDKNGLYWQDLPAYPKQ